LSIRTSLVPPVTSRTLVATGYEGSGV
jgi:hypothetical protein